MAFIPIMWNRMIDSDPMETDSWLTWPEREQMYLRLYPRGGFSDSGYKRKRPVKDKWTYPVQIGDFDPEHVKVKVENGKVLIEAEYTDGNEEWGDTVVKKRSVKIPDDVDSEKIHSSMKSNGTLVLEGPFKKSEESNEQSLPMESEKKGAVVLSDKKNTLMEMDVSNFEPENVKITCKDGILTAQGKREKSENGHIIKESFFRQLTLPKSMDEKNLKCFKNDDGKLTICAASKEDTKMEQS